MAGFTKWITGGLGFVLGGPIGGLIGFVIGAVIDSSATQAVNRSDYEQGERGYTPYSRSRNTAEGDFKMSLLVLIACVMNADGKPHKRELDVVKRFLVVNFGEAGALDALQILKNLLNQKINEADVARQIGQYLNYSAKLEMLHLLIEIAFADGDAVQQELNVLYRISSYMGVSNVDFEAVKAPYYKTKDVNWAYTALELETSATDEEIKKAYRRMAMKYHPDKVASLGEDVKKTATDKFRNINEAYEELKKQKGFN